MTCVTSITSRERAAIKRLQDALQQMPDTLWLFTDGQAMHVMKYKRGRERAVLEHQGMDPLYVVTSITPGCAIDGSDW